VGEALQNTGAWRMTGKVSVIGALPVESVALMKSELHPSGSIYSRLFQVPLTGMKK
jgi:2'-5' RNA ligase